MDSPVEGLLGFDPDAVHRYGEDVEFDEARERALRERVQRDESASEPPSEAAEEPLPQPRPKRRRTLQRPDLDGPGPGDLERIAANAAAEVARKARFCEVWFNSLEGLEEKLSYFDRFHCLVAKKQYACLEFDGDAARVVETIQYDKQELRNAYEQGPSNGAGHSSRTKRPTRSCPRGSSTPSKSTQA